MLFFDQVILKAMAMDETFAKDMEKAVNDLNERMESKKNTIKDIVPILDSDKRIQNVGYMFIMTNGETQPIKIGTKIKVKFSEEYRNYSCRHSKSEFCYVWAEEGKEDDKSFHRSFKLIKKFLTEKNYVVTLQ